MISIPYSYVIKRIESTLKISQSDIESKINEKLEQLHGLISKDGAAAIVANELGVSLYEKVSGSLKLNEVFPGMKSISIVGKISDKSEIREFVNERGKGKVGFFNIFDETGKIKVVLWNDRTQVLNQIKVGDVVKISKLYSKKNNERTEVIFTEESELILNPEGIDIKPKLNISNISEIEDGDNVKLFATIVDVYSPVFFERCSECGKRLKEGPCEEHNTREQSLVINAVIDDGTATARLVLWKVQAEMLFKLINMSEEELMSFKDNKDQASSFSGVKNKLLGLQLKIRGYCKNNQVYNRKELIASYLEKANPKEVSSLLSA